MESNIKGWKKVKIEQTIPPTNKGENNKNEKMVKQTSQKVENVKSNIKGWKKGRK